MADVVAAGNISQRLAEHVAATNRFASLMEGQLRFAAELVRRYRAGMPYSIGASGSSGRDAEAVISMGW